MFQVNQNGPKCFERKNQNILPILFRNLKSGTKEELTSNEKEGICKGNNLKIINL